MRGGVVNAFGFLKSDKRLLRAEPDFRPMARLLQVNWLYVLLVCLLAGVGYIALYSAGVDRQSRLPGRRWSGSASGL